MTLDEILARLGALPEKQRKAVADAAMRATANLVWVPNVGPQMQAYDSPADELFYGGSAGGGKGLRPDAPVLTPFGWRKIGDLKPGDAVCATDGTVTRVLGVYRRGTQPLYRLTFWDGAQIECDADHIWLAWNTGARRKSGNVSIGGEASARKWTTEQIAEHYRSGRTQLRIPIISAPVAFNVAGSLVGKSNFHRRSIPPYVLGVLIGDGCISGNAASFTSADDAIAERVARDLGCELSRYANGGCPQYRIPNACIVPDLKALGLLGCRSEDKFIPRIYLFGSVDERWALLQGLMDTDGWAEDNRGIFYTTVSPRLAEDVKHLARSLGALVGTSDRIPSYTHNGEKRLGQKAYMLRIKMPAPERAFYLARKRSICAGKTYQSMGNPLVSIEPAGKGETICIAVEHPNSLFITSDFLVTHNTELGIGLALTRHRRTLFLRRFNKDALKIVPRLEAILGHRNGYNGQLQRWRLPGDRQIDIAGCEMEQDKQRFKGDPHDLIVFDEGTDFLESQYRFIIGWNRATDPQQRCRVIVTSNPPTTSDGLWVIRYWAPWLDKTHPRPAQPGELRWFTTIDGEDTEVDGPGPHIVPGRDKPVMARSRTFIPASLADNPDLRRTNYGAVLDSLPEEIRRAYRDGDFSAGLRDAEWQLLPTAWIDAAMQRWTERPQNGLAMTAQAIDCAGGGTDSAVLAWRHGGWYAPLVAWRGPETADPFAVVGRIVQHRRDNCPVVVDMGGGYGGGILAALKQQGISAVGFQGSGQSTAKTRDGRIGFVNRRAEAWWRFREELDPHREGGSVIALPNDPELRADLAAVRWEMTTRGIKIEDKDDIRKRLGRSPDKGDAVVMCLAAGTSAAARMLRSFVEPGGRMGRFPIVNLGYAHMKRRH